ncbi:MAG: type VI secretion system baseplate subunit TssK [bacterium]|nr:type VI secretion system baseplate subunit TssK [bacterium]
MSLINEIHWQEGMFLCPHHFQKFQHEIVRGFVNNIKRIYDFPYGLIEYELNERSFTEDKIIIFDKLKVVMPSGYILDISENSFLPPFPIDNIFAEEDKSLTLYLGLPYWMDGKSNLSDRNELKNDKLSRIYSITEEKIKDENTGLNPKTLAIRRLNPKIFSEKENFVDYDAIPIIKITKNEISYIEVDKTFVPPLLTLKASSQMMNLVKNIIQYLKSHTTEYRLQLHDIYEFKSGMGSLQMPIHKLRILSSYCAELTELITNPEKPPYSYYVVFKKLIEELFSIIVDAPYAEIQEYNHKNPYSCFNDINKKLHMLLKVDLINKDFEKLIFNLKENGTYQLDVPERLIKNRYDYFLCIKTKIVPEYLVKKVEEGLSIKCLPSPLVEMAALPGFKLSFLSNVPSELFREYNEYYFSFRKLEEEYWKEFESNHKLTIIERMDRSQGVIDSISLTVKKGH